MQKHNYLVAAAVGAALVSGYASAAVPTVAQAAAPYASLVIAGSSAAQSSIAAAVGTTLCGGANNMLTVTSNASSNANKNFLAYSCNTAITVGSGANSIPAGKLVTIYYRSEGGSVMGAMPIATTTKILRLNLSDASCTSSGNTGTCTVTGVTSQNGPSDSWNGAVVDDTVQLGITDVEPAQLINADYPSNYTVFPTATAAQMAGLGKVRAIQQVFGIAVNKSGLALTTANTVNLSRESVANILKGSYTDWSSVPDAVNGNNTVSSAAAPIVRIDREPGSGTRTSANLYFLNYGCGGGASIQNGVGNFVQTDGTVFLVNSGNTAKPEQMNYATGDELNLANSTPGAIAYASIDNLLPPKNTAYPNLVLATINGVSPSTLAAASGAYDYWYEATLVPNGSVTGLSASLSSWMQTNVPALASAPIAADVNVIPGVGGNIATVGSLDSRSSGTTTIYVNPYTRGGNSCNIPGETNE